MAAAAETIPAAPRWWQAALLGAMAGGMGWGIRGQYGHETGAMIAGLLVGSILVWLFCPTAAALPAARAVAWCTVAIGFGGAMTYGQTVGLTHDPALVGNWEALRWGLMGLAIKGGIWIGFAAVFLGMGLSGIRYRPLEMLALMVGMLGLFALGTWLLNTPFDPNHRLLPKIYFSADWRWQPDADLRPRREVWGGLLFALVGAVAYTGWIRRDPLARALAFWGVLGGAIGFPLGQSLQAFHAWNPDLLRDGFLEALDPHVNWWNFMETTFGAVFGLALGLGVWFHRNLIHVPSVADSPVIIAPVLEWELCLLHAVLVATGEFLTWSVSDAYVEFSLLLGLIPIVAIAAGRWWPWLVMLPITLLPIAGKTLRNLGYQEHAVDPSFGWVLYAIVPLAFTVLATVWAERKTREGSSAGPVLRPLIVVITWLYFILNFAFFRFPWPWDPWTARTPNALLFMLCALGLTLAAWRMHMTAAPVRTVELGG